MKRSMAAGTVIGAVLVAVGSAGADTINVPADQPTIQAGIDAAVNGDEVVVAPGTYAEIIDLSGKAITVHSSGGAAVTTIDATTVTALPDGKPVVRCDNGEGPDTVLERFTITGGTGDTAAVGAAVGGGMYNGVGVSPTINDCVFAGNVGDAAGGGIYNNEASPTITGCTFTNNSTEGFGGAMVDWNDGSPALSGCVFSANHASGDGGAIYHQGDDLTLEGCTFLGNTAGLQFGGIYFSSSGVLTLTNCRVIGNVAAQSPGGMFLNSGPGSALVNCAFIGNVAGGGDGGGVTMQLNDAPIVNCTFAGNSASGNGGGLRLESADPVITNSIFWGNSDASGMDESAQIHRSGAPDTVVSYSLVQGGWGGDGSNNLDADPLFVDADGPDDIVGTADDDLRLSAGSPAIDAGNAPAAGAVIGATDLAGASRLVDDPATADTGVASFGRVIDMGAYEFEFTLPGDLDGDGDVDLFDHAKMQLFFTGPL